MGTLDNMIFAGEQLAKNKNSGKIAIQVRGDKIISSLNEGALNNSKILNNAANSGFATKQDINTLTEIKQDVIRQKFFEFNPSDCIPITVGFGAWADDLLKYRSYMTGDDFEEGDIDLARNSRLSQADVAVDAVKRDVKSWAKQMDYNIIELNQAVLRGNWNLIAEREKSVKQNWDLGIQKVAYKEHSTDPRIRSLYNQIDTDITVDAGTTIPAPVADLSDADFDTFKRSLIQTFFDNSNSTAMPDTFIMPSSDFLRLGGASATAAFPIRGRLELLLEAFKAVTNNDSFQIKGLPYGSASVSGLSKDRYVLYKKSPDVLEMDIPVPYTSLTAETSNNFQFDTVAYGRYTGVQVYRPKEFMYFDLA